MVRMIPEQEIAFKDAKKAFTVANALLDENYVVMVSREENLYIVSYIWAEYANRNDVAFMPRFELDEHFREILDEEESEDENW